MAMHAKKAFLITSILTGVIVLIGGILYEIVLPEMIAKRYTENVYASAQVLRTRFENMPTKIDTPLLTDPSETIAVRKAGTATLKADIDASRNELAEFEKISGSLQPLPYSGYTSSYSHAVTLQERSRQVITQVTDALNDLEAMVTFLEKYTNTLDATKTAINQFNQTVDLSVYTGQSVALRQTADRILTDAELLRQISSPPAFNDIKTATATTLNQAAAGFVQLANGAEVLDDAQVSGAAQQIEAAGQQLDTTHYTNYTTTVRQSRAIQGVHELNEKLDLVLP